MYAAQSEDGKQVGELTKKSEFTNFISYFSVQGDFASLVVADGRLEFRFDTGSGEMVF